WSRPPANRRRRRPARARRAGRTTSTPQGTLWASSPSAVLFGRRFLRLKGSAGRRPRLRGYRARASATALLTSTFESSLRYSELALVSVTGLVPSGGCSAAAATVRAEAAARPGAASTAEPRSAVLPM